MNLNDYTNAWDSTPMAPPTGGDFPPLPDGTYNCVLAKAEVKTAKKSGDPMVSLGFQVVAGPDKGRWVWKNSVICGDQRRLEYLKRDLAYIGVDVRGPIGSLPEQLAGCIGAEITLDLRTKKGNDGTERQNCYLKAPASWVEPEDDSDLPF
jgi:hypothetical protein